MSDAEFDRIYPAWVREVSPFHWTPIDVARRAAELLVVDETTRVLDVGSGIGKFCLVGALVTPATFVGVERQANLVEIARRTAARCNLRRVEFIHANMMSVDWSGFDAIYLFNPYCDEATVSDLEFVQYVTATSVKLATARVGLQVVTYHGYGGPMPPGYRQVAREPAGTDALELWQKESP